MALEYFTYNYLQSNLQFLSRTLLTVPSHLEFVSEYVHTSNNSNGKSIQQYVQDLAKESARESDDAGLLSNISRNAKQSLQLEEYYTTLQHNNIIQLDSDSDCGITSSMGSSILGAMDQEVIDNVISTSLCEHESFTDVPSDHSEYFLEEFEEEPATNVSKFPIPSQLCQRLRPVKISDPFSETFHVKKLEPELSLNVSTQSAYSAELCFEKISLEQNYTNFELEENLIIPEYTYEDNFIKEVLAIKELPEECVSGDSAAFVLQSVSNQSVKTLKFLETMDMDKQQVNKADVPEKINIESSYQKLDSPCSEMIAMINSNDELPSMCTNTENMSGEEISILSPGSKETLKRKIWNEEKTYGDLLLMLLPETEVETFKDFVNISFPADHLPVADIERNVLEWDPIFFATSIMNLAIATLLSKKRRYPAVNVSKSSLFQFQKLNIETDYLESMMEDWKQQERKAHSLQFMTSIKSSQVQVNEPLKPCAPVGYHKRTVIDKSAGMESVTKVTKPMELTTPKFKSPLDSFMLLRTGQSVTKKHTSSISPIKHVSAAKVHPIMKASLHAKSPPAKKTKSLHNAVNNNLKNNKLQLSSKLQSETNDLSANCDIGELQSGTNTSLNHQQQVITIMFNKEYRKIIETIDKDSSSMITFLKEHNCINRGLSLLSLSTDMTRFLLKEEERRNAKERPDILRGFICLHALTQVVNLILHCNILTACAVLNSMNHEHKKVLRNCLEPVRKKLACFHCHNEDNQHIHPKLLKLKELLTKWLTVDQHCKVIILLHRYFECVAPNLQVFLSTIANVKVNLYPKQNISESVYMATFYNANVILAEEGAELESCPWEYFQYVIQFEHRKESCWHKLAYSNNPYLNGFVSLNMTLEQLDTARPEPSDCIVVSENLREHFILSSENLVKDKELLIALEHTENIQVITKNYDWKEGHHRDNVIDHKTGFHPDILVDAETGMLILNIQNLSANCFEEIQEKITSVVMKCSVCKVVILDKEMVTRTQPDEINICSGVALLMTTLNKDLEHVSCKLLYAHSVAQLAKIVRNVCDVAMSGSNSVTHFMKEELTDKEKFLLCYPFLNSICAQMMLEKFDTLNLLLQASQLELLNKLPCIPNHILKAFYNINCSFRSTLSFDQSMLPTAQSHMLESNHQDINDQNKHLLGDQQLLGDEYSGSTAAKPTQDNILAENQLDSNDSPSSCFSLINQDLMQSSFLDQINQIKWDNTHQHNNFDLRQSVKEFATNVTRQSSKFGYSIQQVENTQEDNFHIQNEEMYLNQPQFEKHMSWSECNNDQRNRMIENYNKPSIEQRNQIDSNSVCGFNSLPNTMNSFQNIQQKYHTVPQPVVDSLPRDIQLKSYQRRKSGFPTNKPQWLNQNVPSQSLNRSSGFSTDTNQPFGFYSNNKSLCNNNNNNLKDDYRSVQLCNYGSFGKRANVWETGSGVARDIPKQAVKAFHVVPSQSNDDAGYSSHDYTDFQPNVYKSREGKLQDLTTTPIQRKYNIADYPPQSVSLSTKKERRLVYEKVAGATNGQTRLTFL